MYHLDPVGRLAPTSLDVSRAAAVRHAHVSALREQAEPATTHHAHVRMTQVPARMSSPTVLAGRPTEATWR